MATSRFPDQVDVAAIRAKLARWPQRAVTQEAFARRFGFSPAAVRDWEQRRRVPGSAARTLLLVIAHSPDVVDAALRDAAERSNQHACPKS